MTTVTRPNECSERELDRFVALVEKGDQIGNLSKKRIRRCEFLIRESLEGKLIGVAAIKNPERTYREDVFTKAGSELVPSDYPFELGYIYVEEGYRKDGCGGRLIEHALASVPDQRVYATSREGNSIHGLLRKFGFVGEGVPFVGDGGRIQLFIRA